MEVKGESSHPVTDSNTDDSLQAVMENRETPSSHCLPPPSVPELRLVLVGRKGAGKSSAGNTILGEKAGLESGKPTEECVKRRTDVSGRRVTVVDTPGWEWYYPRNSTPDWVRRETLRSFSLCPPGPHVVLLVVRSCASVTEAYTSQIEEQLESLGKGVWDHTMVLFTRGDELGLVPIEQRILTSGPTLRKILQRCGNRYHVLDNRHKGDGTQVKELMRKMEEMVAEARKTGGGYFGVENMVLLGLEADRKRKARERRKKQRQMEAQTQRGAVRAALMSDGSQVSEADIRLSFSKGSRRLPELRLVLLGERETGKSTAGNTILGGAGFFRTGTVTEECVRQQAEVAMRLVTVVDAPGWEGGVAGPTPERVKREMVGSVALCPPGPHAVLLTLRVDTLVKVGPVREHLELLGEGVWRHTVLLFTHGDQLREGVGIEQRIQSGDLQWLMEKCRGRYHVVSNGDGGRGGGGGIGSGGGAPTQVTELFEKVEKMAAGNRCEAFSGVVQEVSDLSRLKNEKFNQRLKEISNKMLRQEVELKKMREREMKSISSRFFDRRKKTKSPGKANIEREEEEGEEERRSNERKNDMVELEERMRWLTEDKEREIQDLSAENDRIVAALHLRSREREDGLVQLELKEREIEELKERIDEQQQKLLDLERIAVEREGERKQREDEIRVGQQNLTERIEREEREKAELMRTVDALQTDMRETERRYEDILSRRARDDEENAKTMRRLKEEMERKLYEREREMGDIKVQYQTEMKRAFEETETALDGMKHLERETERKLNDKVEEMKSQHRREMDGAFLEREKEVEEIKLRHKEETARTLSEMERLVKENRVQYEEEMKRGLREKEEHMEKVKLRHQAEIRDIQQEAQREMNELKQRINQMETELKENEEEKEVMSSNHRKVMEQGVREKEREIEELRQQHAIELEKKQQKERMNVDYRNEMEKRLREKEREIEELKRRHADQTEERRQAQEKEKERIYLNHKREVEEKLEERDREIEVWKQQQEGDMEKTLREKERVHLKHGTVMKQKLEEKTREIEVLKQLANQTEERLRGKEEKERVDLNKKEKMERRLQENEKERDEMKRQHAIELEKNRREAEERAMKKLQEKDGEMEEIKQRLKEMEGKLQVKEAELEEMKLHADTRETEWRDEQRTRDERKDNEIKGLMDVIENKTQEITQTEQLAARKEKEMEEARERCANHLEEIERLRASDENKTLDIVEIEGRLAERARQKDAETTETLREKEKELDSLRQRDGDKEREILHLRQTIEQTKSELKNLTARMEREMTSMIREYEEEIGRRNEKTESIAKEKEIALSRLERMEEESKRRVSDVTGKYEESQRRVGVLREENEKMRIERDNLRRRCEEREEEEHAARRADIERREAEVRELARKHEEQVATGEFGLRNLVNERDGEIAALKEANETLRGEMERMKEREKELLNEMREHHQRQLMENPKEELSNREREIEARDQDLMRIREQLRNRGHDLETKEEEVAKREGKLETRERDLKKQEADLEVKQREREEMERDVRHKREELSRRERNIERKEEELENCLQVLEVKQEELNSHGQDIQAKIKELRDWGKGLEDRESHLINRERELFSWRTELEKQSERMESKQEEISAMGGELSRLQQELQSRKRGLKDKVEKLRKWQEILERRETVMYERERGRGGKEKEAEFRRPDGDQCNGEYEVDAGEWNWQVSGDNGVHGKSFCNSTAVFGDSPGAADDAHVMYQEVGVVEEREREDEERGKESHRSSKEREDQRIETAPSAIGSNNCQFDTLGEIETRGDDGQEEEMKERGAEERKGKKEGEETEDAKVIGDVKSLSSSQGRRVANIKDSPASELRVVVLGETRSSPYPATVTVLGGEATRPGGSTSVPWRGQIAGRHVSLVEPTGLSWRNGTDPTDAAQEKSILDNVSLFHPGPHVLLLVIPAYLAFTRKYRRAVERHVGLLGEKIWCRTLVLFTWGEALGESAEQHILRNGDLMWLVEKCRGRYHVLTSKNDNEGLFEKIEEMVALNDRDGSFV